MKDLLEDNDNDLICPICGYINTSEYLRLVINQQLYLVSRSNDGKETEFKVECEKCYCNFILCTDVYVSYQNKRSKYYPNFEKKELITQRLRQFFYSRRLDFFRPRVRYLIKILRNLKKEK